MTISECLKHGTTEIGQRDTITILRHILKCTTAYVLLNEDQFLDDYKEFIQCVSRYKHGEPLQYILGCWDFYGHLLKVDNRALIPRPETELLVEEAIFFLQSLPQKPRVLDLCTGSGCIATAIAKSGDFDVVATDISEQALSLARENGEEYGVTFIQSNLFEYVEGKFDLIVSNPPYITTHEMGELSPTLLNYEPHLALHGGGDGMDLYRRLIPESLRFLKPNAILMLEIGPEAVKGILEQEGFANVQLKKDYAGLPRIVSGIRSK